MAAADDKMVDTGEKTGTAGRLKKIAKFVEGRVET